MASVEQERCPRQKGGSPPARQHLEQQSCGDNKKSIRKSEKIHEEYQPLSIVARLGLVAKELPAEDALSYALRLQ